MAMETGALLLLYDFVHWSNATVAAAVVVVGVASVQLFFGIFFLVALLCLSIVVLVKCNQARDHTIFLRKRQFIISPTLATVFIQIIR